MRGWAQPGRRGLGREVHHLGLFLAGRLTWIFRVFLSRGRSAGPPPQAARQSCLWVRCCVVNVGRRSSRSRWGWWSPGHKPRVSDLGEAAGSCLDFGRQTRAGAEPAVRTGRDWCGHRRDPLREQGCPFWGPKPLGGLCSDKIAAHALQVILQYKSLNSSPGAKLPGSLDFGNMYVCYLKEIWNLYSHFCLLSV